MENMTRQVDSRGINSLPRGQISVRPETQVMSSQNVVHHKPTPPAVSPVIVLDELVKKAVRKEWLELDYGAHWWSNDHAPTIYANSKLIPPLNTFISNRWSELKPILVKRPVAAKKIRLRKPTEEGENGSQDAEQENADETLVNAADTSDACNQSSDHSDTLDLISLLLSSPPDVKPTKLLQGLDFDHIPSSSANNRLFSMPVLNETSQSVAATVGGIGTEEISSTTTPSISGNSSYPQVKSVKDKENSLKMKIKLGDSKNKKVTSGNKEVKPRDGSKLKKSKAPKSDAPKKRKRTIKITYPKSCNLKRCSVVVVRVSDEVLKNYTGLTNEDLKSYYYKKKSSKCSSSNKNKSSIKHANQLELLQNHTNTDTASPNRVKIFPRNICGSPPGPLSKKPWNLLKAKNKQSVNVLNAPSTSAQCNNTILVDSSMTSIEIASTSSSASPPSSTSSDLTTVTSSEPQNSLFSTSVSTSNVLPVKLNSPCSAESLELSKEESFPIAIMSPGPSTEEMINCEITKPSSDTIESSNDVVEAVNIKVHEEVPESTKTVTVPMEEEKEVPVPAEIVNPQSNEIPELENTVSVPTDEVPNEQVPETAVNSPLNESVEPAKSVIVSSLPESSKIDIDLLDETDSDTTDFPGFDCSDIPLKIDEKEESTIFDSIDQALLLDENLQSNSSSNDAASLKTSTESECPVSSNIDNKKLENRTKLINGGKNNELLLKMLASPPPSKSKPISDYVNGKIIPLGQKHSSPALAVIIKRKSTDDSPVISASLSLAANESNTDTNSKEETDKNIIKEISSPEPATDVNMNYPSKVLINGSFTTKNQPVQKSKHKEIGSLCNTDKADSSECNKENTSYERNKLEDSLSPPAKKMKTEERSDENITKSNLKIDLSKMEFEQEEEEDADKTITTETTDLPASEQVNINTKEKTVLDLPLNIFENYECITCLNKFLHLNDWRLHFNDYPQCANAQDCL